MPSIRQPRWGAVSFPRALRAIASAAPLLVTACQGNGTTAGLDLGLAARAELTVRRLPDGAYLRVLKDPIYFDPSCDGFVDGGDLIEARPAMYFRIADDLSGLSAIPIPSGQPGAFAPTLGRGAAFVEIQPSEPEVLLGLALFDGETTTTASWDELRADDPADATDQATTAIVAYVAEPAAGRLLYVDSSAQLRRFEDGQVRTLARLEQPASILTVDATTVVLGRIDDARERLVLEHRSTIDGSVTSAARGIELADLGDLAIVPSPNGTPSDYRVFLGSGGRVLRVTDSSHREERLPAFRLLQSRLGSMDLTFSAGAGARWVVSETGRAQVLAVADEIGEQPCELSRGTTWCEVPAGCERTRAVGDLDGTRGVRVSYTAALPTDPRRDSGSIDIALEAISPRAPLEIPLETALDLRVVPFLRPGELSGEPYSPPPVTISVESLSIGSTHPLAADLAYGTESTFVTVPVTTAEDRNLLRLHAFLSDGTSIGSVDASAFAERGRATIVVWLDDLGEMRAVVSDDRAEDLAQPVQLSTVVLQSAANAASGLRVLKEQVFWACVEPACRTSMCREPFVGELDPDASHLVLAGQLGRAVRFTYGAPPSTVEAPCPGEPLAEWTYLATDMPSFRIVIFDALGPSGATVVELGRDPS